ncbi:MAG: trypsin-like peptidase domain-containing protein [Microthrixaceae bacterium]
MDDPAFPLDFTKIPGLEEVISRDDSADLYGDLYESICGTTDDSQPVEQYDGTLGVTQVFVNARQAPVGQLQWNSNLASMYDNPGTVSGVRWCTGTMISNDLFLTAGHCFDQTGGGWLRPRVDGTTNVISNEDIALNMHVNFNYQVDPAGALRTEQSYPIVDLLEYRLGGLDFAIVRLDGNPGATWGTTKISAGDATVGDMIAIIGHPAGVPKRIEAGPVTGLSGNFLLYDDIDTLGGNSGSGIVRASDGCIVGIHTNGGCDQPAIGNNRGVRIEAAIAQSPTLQKVAKHTAAFLDAFVTHPGLDKRQTQPWLDIKATLAWLDKRPTLSWLDGLGTSPIVDAPTSPLADQRGTPRKSFDDVKLTAYDKQFSDATRPTTGAAQPPYPSLARGGAQPFVLTTPHHAPGVGGGSEIGDEMEAAREAIALVEAAIIETGELLALLETQHAAMVKEATEHFQQDER